MDTLDWTAKWADYTPEKIAITSYDANKSYSYKDLHRYANRLINKLIELDLEEGDRIAVLAEHSLEYIVLFVACQRMGVILVPLNYRQPINQIAKLIVDCTPSLFIYNDNHQDKAAQLPIQNIKNIPFNKLESYFQATVNTLDNTQEKTYSIKEDNPLFIFYTSGTTGDPKGVIYTNKMLFWNSLNTSMQLGITFRDSTLNTLPPYHTSGWNVFITPLLHKGAHIGMLEKFDAEKILCLLELNKTTLFMALPTMLLMMQKTSVFKDVNLKKLRYIISGGEKVASELVRFWKTKKNIHIRPGYGLTEAGPSITSLHHEMAELKPNSIGKPNFYLDLKIVDKNGNKVKANEVGELCIKGNIVTPGYWNNSVKTNSKIKKGWLFTGDFAYSDAEGFLYMKGRKNDMYISGGENIYPQEIEVQLERIKDIKKAVVLSVRDAKWGECGIAFVTTANKQLSVMEIRESLKANLVAFKHPKYLFILEEIPLTSIGKVSRKKLFKYFNTVKSQS
ncbi:class I adenylate-forming enzyme family protein [Oceanihabitans sp. 2_MG-2023]|uniref:class I adenylate-forming enzyme family protein n=1 Tax=Oceanihabitans sp. 2_MG-2023 TaxID=3062661 RepID=UPI0026E130C4|nr:class I adenylate-forming enzyme family protein [Oceanihabitans sp. 2_MG-2023]MDO6595548.1 class I adenylate-forming enzyme family protein [Oceanihabitans sp. 2_MG-2023]